MPTPVQLASLGVTTSQVRAVRPGTGGSGVATSPIGDLAPLIGQLITALTGRDQAVRGTAATQAAHGENVSRPSTASAAAGSIQAVAARVSSQATVAASTEDEPGTSGVALTPQVVIAGPGSTSQADSESELVRSLAEDDMSSSEGDSDQRASASPGSVGPQVTQKPDTEVKPEEGLVGLPAFLQRL